MSKIAAFVGHSFEETDKSIVRSFTDYFDTIEKMPIGFTWAHAEDAEPKTLSDKVVGMMKAKNLFIGICTARERVVSQGRVTPFPLWNSMFWGRSAEFRLKTSDWIIQEIGLARGLGIDIMILLESGVRRPGGLQGDLNYISFDRDSPSKSFPQILQMLTALTPQTAVQGSVPSDQEIVTEKKPMSKPAEEMAAATSTPITEDEFDFAVFDAIVKGDTTKEKSLLEAYATSPLGIDPQSQARFEANALDYRRMLGKGINVSRLQELAATHPSDSEILMILGNAYRSYGDHVKAAEAYERSAEGSIAPSSKIFQLSNAAIERAKSGQQNVEAWLLDHALPFLTGNTLETSPLLSALKDLAAAQKMSEKVQVYGESLLDLKPEDDELRASLAWEYMNAGNNCLALFHYCLLPGAERNGMHWNNLGVVRTRLDLDAKGIESYRKAETLGESLAMANLANSLIGKGFLKEAEEICARAVMIKDYDNHVNVALTRISEVREKESEKERTLRESVEPQHRFYVAFGLACLKPTPNGIQQRWQSPECVLQLNIHDGQLIAEGTYERESVGAVALALHAKAHGGFGFGATPTRDRMKVHYEGQITGHGVYFKRTIGKEGEPSTLLTSYPEERGLLLFSDDFSRAKVFIKTEATSRLFFDLQMMQ